MLENLKVRLHYLMPKHILTVIIGCLASLKLGKGTTLAIEKFAKFYNINLAEIKGNIKDFETFNDFFARELKKSARPIDADAESIVFPADGRISQYGHLLENVQIQAKGHYFSTTALLGNDNDANIFTNGKFMTVYLSPSDYHRVHLPIAGKLLKMTYVPGEFFSVNPLYVRNIPELFSRNERVICIFETAIGKMAVVFVGATIVRSISTSWAGIVAPSTIREASVTDYSNRNITFSKGDEIGRFTMGSTVICLFEKDKIDFENLELESHVLMGEKMAHIAKGNTEVKSISATKSAKTKRTTKAKKAKK